MPRLYLKPTDSDSPGVGLRYLYFFSKHHWLLWCTTPCKNVWFISYEHWLWSQTSLGLNLFYRLVIIWPGLFVISIIIKYLNCHIFIFLALKREKVKLAACGRNHTLVSTGIVFNLYDFLPNLRTEVSLQ